VATPRTNQLDINLSRISDVAVRDCMSSLITFVNSMSQGLRTGGDVKGKSIANDVGSAGLDKNGGIFGSFLELDSGGKFRVKVVSGTNSALAVKTITVLDPYIIVGAFGVTQLNTSTTWQVMTTDPTVSSANYINVIMTNAQTVEVTSTDVNTSNDFHLVVFYK